MAARFLLLTIRPEDDAASAEYASVLSASGLEASELSQLRLESAPLGAALDGVAGVIVGGSPLNVTEADKSDGQLRVEADLSTLARVSVEQGLPTMFTCYGIGVAALALGGSVDNENGEDVGPVAIHLSPEAADDPLFSRLPSVFDAFVGHKESVASLPPGAVLLGSSETCPVQAFRMGDVTWAMQFHPEPTGADLAARARVYKDHGYFDSSALSEVEERILSRPVTEPRTLLRSFVELAAH